MKRTVVQMASPVVSLTSTFLVLFMKNKSSYFYLHNKIFSLQ